MKPRWQLRKFRFGTVIALVLSLYVLNYIVTPLIVGEAKLESSFRPYSVEKFDSQSWRTSGLVKAGKHGKDSPNYGERYKTIDDLLKSHNLVGMREDQVRAILGDPDAGILDKKSLANWPQPYGDETPKVQKEILNSPDNIAIWSYHLSFQRQYPAKSILFPLRFYNGDRWKLLLKLKNGQVSDTAVRF